MADYDAEVRIHTKVDTSEVDELNKALHGTASTADDTAESVNDVSDKADKTANDLKKVKEETAEITKEVDKAAKAVSDMTDSSQTQSLALQIEKARDKVSGLKEKMDELAGKKVYNEDYTDLEKELSRLMGAYNKLTEKAENWQGSKRSNSWQQLQQNIENTKNEIDELRKRKEDYDKAGNMYSMGSETPEYDKLSKEYDYAQKSLAILEKKQEEYEDKKSAGEAKAQEQAAKSLQKENERIQKQEQAEASLAAKQAERAQKIEAQEEKRRQKEAAAMMEQQKYESIRAEAVVGDENIVKLAEEQEKIQQRIAELKKAGVTDGYKEYDELKGRLAEIDKTIKGNTASMKKLPKVGKKSMNALGASTKKTGSLLSTLGSRFKGIALSLLIFNWISKGFNAMISGMKTGFQHLAKYSDEYNKNMSEMKGGTEQLQNGLAAAFEPVANFIIPMINSLIAKLNEGAEQVSRFMAIISGKSSYTRAKKQVTDYAKSLDSASNAAKGALASFDSLEVLDTGDNSGSKSGSDMFEDVSLEGADLSMYDALLEKIAQIKEYAAELKDIFAKGFFDGLGDYEGKFDTIKHAIQGIKDALINIWTDTAVLSACDGWIKSVAGLLGTAVGALFSIGLTIAANLLGGLEQYLTENTDRIREYLISMFDIWADINNMLSDFLTAFAYVFSAFASENGIAVTSSLIGIFADAFMGISQLCAEMTKSIVELLTKPFVDNADTIREALEGTLGVIATLLSSVKDIVDEVVDDLLSLYEEHIAPVISDLTQILSEFVGNVLAWFNEDILPIIRNAADEISSIVEDNILPIIDNIIETIGGIIDILKVLFDRYLKQQLEWLKNVLLPVATVVFKTVTNMFTSLLRTATTVIKAITQILKGLVEFIAGVMTGDMDRAFEGLKDIFSGFKTFISGVVNGILGIVETMANGVVDSINMVIRALNKLSFDVPDWVPLIGGESWGFNLTELEHVKLPRLATGGITMGPTRALIGEAGREAVLPLENNTEWMDELADRIGNGARGPVTVVLEMDGKEFARAQVPYINAENSRIGTDLKMT